MAHLAQAAAPVALLLAVLLGLSGCGGGGGGSPPNSNSGEPPFDSSFLQLDPPGTLVTSGSAAPATNVFVLSTAEGITVDPGVGTVTLSAPARSYHSGDVVLGDGDFEFAYRVTAVNTAGPPMVLAVVPASLPEIIQDGQLSVRATPDWRAVVDELEGSAFTALPEFTVLPDGTIGLANLTVLDLVINGNGTVDWSSSSFLGEPLSPNDPRLGQVDTAAAAGGRVTATIAQGSIRATPTWVFNPQFEAGVLTNVHGTMNVHAVCEFEMTVTVSGHQGGNAQFSWDCSGSLLDWSYPFVFTAGTVPVYGKIGLKVPVDLTLDAEVGGTYTITQRTEAAIQVRMNYTPGTGLSVEKTTSRTMTGSSPTQGQLEGAYRVTTTLDIAPKAYVQFYGVVAPYLALHARGQLEVEYPWQADDPEVLLSLTGSAGLEIDLLFRQLDLKVDPLFEWQKEWDLWGPAGTATNRPPTASHLTTTSPPSGTIVPLHGTDPDDDSLMFSIARSPAHGVLGLVDASTGQVPYYPDPGYLGSDEFRFRVTDGRLSSSEGSVTIAVVSGNPPNASFFSFADQLTVDVDATASTDPEDPPSALEVRWDWTNDGEWDTEWTTSRVASHTYPQPGSHVVRLAIRDTAGMIASTTRGVNVTGQAGAIGPNLAPIMAGSFQMGSGAFVSQYPWTVNELPVHTVHITRSFWMGKYEVTQSEFQDVMGYNPVSWLYPQGPTLPAHSVTWNSAMEYCALLTVREQMAGRVPVGFQYRLPTEAEWEYCCRAGTTGQWYTGGAPNCSSANIAIGTPSSATPCVNSTSVVGSYAPNPWGIHDTCGNLWEYCLDHWNASETPNYPSAPVSDPYVAVGANRVIRGGAWNFPSFYCRSATRGSEPPSVPYSNIGFRVVLAPRLVQ